MIGLDTVISIAVACMVGGFAIAAYFMVKAAEREQADRFDQLELEYRWRRLSELELTDD